MAGIEIITRTAIPNIKSIKFVIISDSVSQTYITPKPNKPSHK
jgi:hypothetical protein